MFIIIWIALCFVAGAIASKKGRSAVGFFFLALFLSPLVGIIVAAIVKPNTENVERQQVDTGAMKKCPYCAELIKTEAIVCRYCGRDLEAMPAPAHSEPIVSEPPVAVVPREPAPPITNIDEAAKFYGVKSLDDPN